MARSNTYATRPSPDSASASSAGAPKLSPEWQRLLYVLNEAPRLPTVPGEHGERLAVEVQGATQNTSVTYVYEWNAVYLNQLHDALSAVVRVHGTGAEGWGAAKWAVYDAVRLTMSDQSARAAAC